MRIGITRVTTLVTQSKIVLAVSRPRIAGLLEVTGVQMPDDIFLCIVLSCLLSHHVTEITAENVFNAVCNVYQSKGCAPV